jgi:hypothetical protein
MSDYLLAKWDAEDRAELAELQRKMVALHYLAGGFGYDVKHGPENAKLAELVDKMTRVLEGTLDIETLRADAAAALGLVTEVTE